MIHKPPPRRVLVSTPLETFGLPPGSIVVSTVASQTPTSFLRISCSGPGLGMGISCPGGGADCFFSWATADPTRNAAAMAAIPQTHNARLIGNLLVRTTGHYWTNGQRFWPRPGEIASEFLLNRRLRAHDILCSGKSAAIQWMLETPSLIESQLEGAVRDGSP